MSSSSLPLALGRVLVSAAAADGRLGAGEIEALRDLLFRLPDLREEDWTLLEEELRHPPALADRHERVAALEEAIAGPEERALAVEALRELGDLAGPLSPADREVLREIQDALERPAEPQGLVGRLGRWLEAPLRIRMGALSGFLRGQERLREDLAARGGERLREELGTAGAGFDPEELERLTLAGVLLAHVAQVDGRVDADEVEGIRRALEEHAGLSPAQARVVGDMALEEAAGELDLHAAVRGFFERTVEAERVAFLDALFHVAAADGEASVDEIEEIRRIRRGLLLSHRQFIAAKLKLPPENRAR